jgi:hypothetical protein
MSSRPVQITAGALRGDGFFALEGQAHCPLPRNEEFVLGGKLSAGATSAKRRFVASFNPLVRQFRRRTWSAAEI